MRRRVIWVILRKELRESLRDRRTLFLMVGLPVLFYPLMILGFSKLFDVQTEAGEAQASRVQLWGDAPPVLVRSLSENRRLRLENVGALPDSVSREINSGRLAPPPPRKREETTERKAEPEPETLLQLAARPLILDRRVDAVLFAWPGFSSALEQQRLGHVSILFDSVRSESRLARDRLSDELAGFRTDLVSGRVRTKRLGEGFATALEIHSQNVASSARRSGQFLGMMLPFLLIVMSATGGFYAAIDLTAGEKERGTMQTLLCAPLRPVEIVVGKLVAAWGIGMIASFANVASLGATFARISVPGGQIRVGLTAYALAFAMLVPVSLTVTAIFVAVAVFARDFKDGQNYLTPMLFALMLPCAAAMVPGIELNLWTSFVPVANIALLMKALFLGEARADLVLAVLVSSLVWAWLAVVFAARIFERENILLGGRDTLRGIFSFERRPGLTPAADDALLFYAGLQVLLFYGALLLKDAGTAVAVPVVEYAFLLAPTLALVVAKRYSWQASLNVRPAAWNAWPAAMLLGLSAWTVGGGLLVRLLPPPESLVRALEKILLLDGKAMPLWVVWLVVAITPAICEELLFRGLLLSALRGLGMWPALLITSLLFGLAHASIYRLLPTLFLGLVFGYLVWRSGSVLTGIVAHALNNGLMATLVHYRPLGEFRNLGQSVFLPWDLIAVGSMVMITGLLLLRLRTR
jgi:sodium transport system permease protein